MDGTTSAMSARQAASMRESPPVKRVPAVAEPGDRVAAARRQHEHALREREERPGIAAPEPVRVGLTGCDVVEGRERGRGRDGRPRGGHGRPEGLVEVGGGREGEALAGGGLVEVELQGTRGGAGAQDGDLDGAVAGFAGGEELDVEFEDIGLVSWC
ncbi:hypothetical protein VTK26DRAFT_5715 [Humicola hyalothermophila]